MAYQHALALAADSAPLFLSGADSAVPALHWGDYAAPSPESTSAIRELARAEGVFVGPVYTGKGFVGLLDHARSGRIPAGSNVAFLHTGDTGNLFEIPEVVGGIAAE